MERQEPFIVTPAAPQSAPHPSLAVPLTTTAIERLVRHAMKLPGLTSDTVLLMADALHEAILEAPSDSDTRRLRTLRDQLRHMAPILARAPLGKAEAAALLRVCPATASALRMWRASMPVSCSAWGWSPILSALIAAAEDMELAGEHAA